MHRVIRIRGRAVAFSCGLIAILAVAVLALGPPASSVAGGATSAGTVCGHLHPDATFHVEARHLGVEHACEHLQGRSWARNHTYSAAVEHRDYERAVATLDDTDPAVVGQWSNAVNPGTKTVGISSVLLHTGKVLIFGGKYTATQEFTSAYVYDPVTGTGHEVPSPGAVFCGSVTQLSDGRVLTAGGADPVPHGIVDVYLFDPATDQWIRQPDTPLGRYYPTSTKLADGSIVIAAGAEPDGHTANPTVDLYTPPPAGEDVGTLRTLEQQHTSRTYPH